MARYKDSVCRLCRREGEKLFLKGDRCTTEKCAIERRHYPPGQHGQGRVKHSDYGIQLREKQKLKRIYGVLERQFRKTFYEANRMKGVTGENLLRLLECRLDNTIYRLGLARSHAEARQMIRHGHISVNGRGVMAPSFTIKAGDKIEMHENLRKNEQVRAAVEVASRRGMVPWLEFDKGAFAGLVRSVPQRDELPMPVRDVREQLIVELYSK